MFTQVFDDGTQAVFDDAGNPVRYTDTSGRTFQADTSVLNRFADMVTRGASAWLDMTLQGKRLQQQAAYPQFFPQSNPMGAAMNSVLPLVMVGGVAFLAYKLIKG